MRIVAGEAKGRKIKAPLGRQVRPTSDRVREALFSSLGYRVVGATVLDLFAGSGALGLEALSRGASRVVFAERSRPVLAVLFSNIEVVRFGDRCSVIKGDALKALANLSAAGESFDLIFLDPPYGSGLLGQVLEIIDDNKILAVDGRVVAEHENSQELAFQRCKSLRIGASKAYGGTRITMLDLVADQASSAHQEE